VKPENLGSYRVNAGTSSTENSGGVSRLAVLVGVVLLGFAMSGRSEEPATPAQLLHGLFDSYLQQRFALDPYYATTKREMRFNHTFANIWEPAWIDRRVALEQEYLEAAMAIPEEALSPRLRIDRRAFLHTRHKYLDHYSFPHHLLPVSPVSSRLNNFARMGSGNYYFAFDTVKDYEDWLARVDAAGPWFEQMIVNFQQGIERGVVHPRVIAERVLAQITTHIVDDPRDSLYYRPISNMPAAFPAADRQRLEAAYRRMITDTLVPTYRRIAAFMQEQYLPASRASTGLCVRRSASRARWPTGWCSYVTTLPSILAANRRYWRPTRLCSPRRRPLPDDCSA
jgi:uncharacterized protein (DUF885 family)